jgi:cell wall-associated NlpC family hydrolase
MKRVLLTFLLFGALTCSAIVGTPATLEGKSRTKHAMKASKKHAHRSGKARSKKSRHTTTSKAELRRQLHREKALTTLREYLPEYADILETRPSSEYAPTFAALPIPPLPQHFDARSPFLLPSLRLSLISNIGDWLGTRYRMGGRSHRGVDCSGFTSAVITETLNLTFAGSSRTQATMVEPVFQKDSLQFGDLLFFTGTRRNAHRIGHVGIYLGNGTFAHSSTHEGVTISHLTDGYYTSRFRWGGRMVDATEGSPSQISAYLKP